MRLQTGALLIAAALLSGCGPAPTTERDARAAPETAATSGGPTGQTPPYEAPGGAPNQVASQPDAAGPSEGEGNPPT